MARRQQRQRPPEPIQLPLFAERVLLTRQRAGRSGWEYFLIEVWPDLFGRALLLQQWRRSGCPGRSRLDAFRDAGAAVNALAALARAKLRRGYSEQIAQALVHAAPTRPRRARTGRGSAAPGLGGPATEVSGAASGGRDHRSLG